MKISTHTLHSFYKPLLFAGFLCILTTLTASFSFRLATSDLWGQLGLNQEAGLEHIKRSFLEGYLSHGRAKVLSGDKLAITTELLNHTRQYVASDAFKAAYEQERMNRKPVPAQSDGPKTKEQIQQKLINDTKEALEQYEQMISTLEPEDRKAMEESLQVYRDQIKSYEDPDNPLLDYMVESEKMAFDAEVQENAEQLKKWEDEFPADCNQLVKKRLEKFLELTRDVDYDAALKDHYGKKKFVNPVYEQKPAEWKFAYRSGKEVTETARAFAKQWLSEIQ